MFRHPIFLSFIAVTCYALNGAIVERWLRVNHPLWNQAIANGLLPLYCCICLATLRAPTGTQHLKTDPLYAIGFAVVCSFILFVGHNAFYAAVANGGNMTSITSIISLLPVLTTLFILCLGGKLPSFNQLVGAALVLLGVLLFLRK